MEIRKERWTFERIARLGFLIGSGWDQERIAKDPIIACRPRSVQRQANRYGLIFSDAALSPMRLSAKQAEVFDRAATKRYTTAEFLVRNLLIIIAEEPNLIDNILDDGDFYA